jgi:hypothetical protein
MGARCCCGKRTCASISAGALDLFQWLVARIRAAWPEVRIVIRGDSTFAREPLMAYCERGQDLYHVFGLAKNTRLRRALLTQLAEAKAQYGKTGEAARVYTEFRYRTRASYV